MLTREARTTMQPHQLPEISRSPLDSCCLRIKALGLGSIRKTFKKLPTNPETAAVACALRMLAGLGIFELDNSTEPGSSQAVAEDPANWPAERLTPLGHTLAQLPLEPRVGKLLVLSAVFGCVDPVLVIAASLERTPFYAPMSRREAATEASDAHLISI